LLNDTIYSKRSVTVNIISVRKELRNFLVLPCRLFEPGDSSPDLNPGSACWLHGAVIEEKEEEKCKNDL